MCGEGRAGKREANGKSREEEMHEWVRIGRCRIWNGVGLRSGWGGTEHDEGSGNRSGTGEEGAWRGEVGGTYVRHGARGRDEEERKGRGWRNLCGWKGTEWGWAGRGGQYGTREGGGDKKREGEGMDGVCVGARVGSHTSKQLL